MPASKKRQAAGSVTIDSTPDAFAFTDVTGATVSTVYTSNTITVAGLGPAVSIVANITGGEYSKNGGAYTSLAGTATNGDTFAVRHTSSASIDTVTNTTLTLGAVADTYSTTTAAAAALDAPVLAQTSAAGAAPFTMDVTYDTDTVQDGDFLHWQIATDSAFTAITQEDTFILEPADIAGGETSDWGYTTPSGLFYIRARVERDDGISTITSAWSNTEGDTIVATTTTLDPANKNSAVSLSGGNLTAVGLDHNANQLVRTTNQVAIGGKYYAEAAITLASGGGFLMGACNSAASMTDFSMPGEFGSGTGGGLAASNYLVPSGTFSGRGMTTGDVQQLAIYRVDASTVKIWVGANGTWLNGDPSAGTGGESVSITSCYGFFGVRRVDTITVNFGATAYTHTKPTGFTAWN